MSSDLIQHQFLVNINIIEFKILFYFLVSVCVIIHGKQHFHEKQEGPKGGQPDPSPAFSGQSKCMDSHTLTQGQM